MYFTKVIVIDPIQLRTKESLIHVCFLQKACCKISEIYGSIVNYFKLGRGSKIINDVFAAYATSKLTMAGTVFTRTINEKM